MQLRAKLLGVWACVAILAAVSCAPDSQSTPFVARHPIVYGLTLQPSGFDPHRNASSELGIVLRQVYDTLVYRDPETDEIVPGLAESWTISDDGMTYTFTLRQGVTFQDGTPFNAQAVAANLDRITDPETASQRAVFMLGPYAQYEVVDEYTIRLLLSEPYTPLLDSLSQVYLGIASPASFDGVSVDRYQFHQVGTGPFSFVEYVPGDRLVLRRNTAYNWGPSFYQAATNASVDEITFRFFTDPPTRSLALESGEAQVMGELPPTDARALSGNSTLQIAPVGVPGMPFQFLINMNRFPTDNLGVRRALIIGTNRNAIVDAVYQRFSPVAWGPLTAGTLYYNRELTGVYAHDTAQAQALLLDAGYTDTDGNGYLDIGGADVEVSIIVPPWGFAPDVAQLLQDQWRTLGIKVTLRPVPGLPALLEAVSAGDYNLVAFNTSGIDPSVLNQFYMSEGANNFSGIANSELDAALLEASRMADSDARGVLYGQIQAYIMDQALVLPIHDPVNLNAANAAVSGLEFDAYGWFPILNNVTIIGGS
jgi:peptide/nickel transport system substrate-binding protein